MRRSQNLPLLPRIYPPVFNKCICATLPESTHPSQNIPPFSTTICGPLRIYPSLPEYTPPFLKCICAALLESVPLHPRIYPLFKNCMRPSQNLPLHPRIYLPFQQMYMCDLSRIYPPSQNKPPFSTTVCNPLRIYASLPEYIPFFNN